MDQTQEGNSTMVRCSYKYACWKKKMALVGIKNKNGSYRYYFRQSKIVDVLKNGKVALNGEELISLFFRKKKCYIMELI